uniref:Uncharacterized protein n=1 Tax=Peronospora matthiolae TaxID=2874970 RepID=A0AAV1T9M7_9STRA
MQPTPQTQSLPTWASAYYNATTTATMDTCKPLVAAMNDEDPMYLSGEETDCDSERSSDTLSREDQQVMTKFIKLHRERARKQVPDAAIGHPDAVRATPVLIPLQSRKYVATSTKRWLWDDDDDDDDHDNEGGDDCAQCACCHRESVERWSGPQLLVHDLVAKEAKEPSPSDLMFDFEL